ncbi:MAG: cobalamin B12-binding domain-containing protein [Planctomycetes bacterium]|nr:cobalamin B12-binding domain-containing protein [Planctomycetota bacterium]
MKISIVNPHIPVFQRDYAFRKTRRWQPLSTAIVAAWLERQGGWQIQFLDAHVMDWDAAEVVRRVRDFAPDVLFYSSERTDAWELPIPDLGYIEHFFAEARREHVRPRSILLEGPHGSIFPEDMLRRLPEVDACLRGETEPVSFAALSALAAGQGFAQVPSVTWREPGGRVVSNPEDPDPIKYRDFPSPAWHLLPMDRYRDAQAPHVPFAMLETSRGCPMPCGYCYKQMFRDRQSKRAPIQVLDEVQEVVAKYGVRRIMFQDQYFTLDRGHVAAICEGLIARALHRVIEWRCQTRLNGMKQGLLHLMRNAGCVELRRDLHRSRDRQRDPAEAPLQARDRGVPRVSPLRRVDRPEDQPKHDPRAARRDLCHGHAVAPLLPQVGRGHGPEREHHLPDDALLRRGGGARRALRQRLGRGRRGSRARGHGSRPAGHRPHPAQGAPSQQGAPLEEAALAPVRGRVRPRGRAQTAARERGRARTRRSRAIETRSRVREFFLRRTRTASSKRDRCALSCARRSGCVMPRQAANRVRLNAIQNKLKRKSVHSPTSG